MWKGIANCTVSLSTESLSFYADKKFVEYYKNFSDWESHIPQIVSTYRMSRPEFNIANLSYLVKSYSNSGMASEKNLRILNSILEDYRIIVFEEIDTIIYILTT
jgi:hypothetical protein